jgi:hypothetical protein
MTVVRPDIPNRFYQTTPRAYAFATATFTPDASATDIFVLLGAAGKIVRLQRLVLSGTQTTAGNVGHVSIVKRTAANTGGTAVAGSMVKLDTLADAATSSVVHYTGNPAGVGAGSTAWNSRVLIPAPATVHDGVIFDLDFTQSVNMPPFCILRGLEYLAISLGGTTPTGAANFQVSGLITED